MKKLNHSVFKKSLLAFALTACSSVWATSTAITNATVYTATEQGILKNATVVFENGKITAINPTSMNVDTTIDAKGQILTPGFIGSMNQLGLVEVGAVARSRDAGFKKANITFDPSLAFNPKSSLVSYARKGGITRDVIVPSGGDSIFAGLASVVDLSGEFDSVQTSKMAVLVNLGSESKGSRAHTLSQLIDKLEKQQKKLAKAKKANSEKKSKKDKKDPTKEALILTALLTGEKPLIIRASRAQELLQLIKLKEQFSLNLIIADAGDAIAVKEQLAQANVPVIISAMDNLPSSFDSLNASLQNAGILEKAGVKVGLSIFGDGTHNLYQLRFDAGNAISHGMSQFGALKAVSANIADMFGINAGKIAVGKAADLSLWSADPFELSSKVQTLWIGGEQYSTESRQDKLRERYMKQSHLPKAYSK
ncbi:amidohydrolase family protein [Pseudoalteromonas denitrificans]|uniref:Imidazolonepropionase n=1 Tax=Pseudoalteromonas denitrificans DSM 6059 TaxID=1123010 RepID=A0A1I1P9P1_9GAMM|nr:amidohydrolase family protein [Pseudoalteromonas denitrificans]SFD06557.1 Imidazolonepropionase [Pseudoalteromonas denitrificans DSM 6059]